MAGMRGHQNRIRSWVQLRAAHHLSLISTQNQHWSWRQQVPRKHWHPCTRLYCVLRHIELRRDAKGQLKTKILWSKEKGLPSISNLSKGHCTAILFTPTSWKKKIGNGKKEFIKYVCKVFISNSIFVTEDRQSERQERAHAVSNLLHFTTCGTGEIPHSCVHSSLSFCCTPCLSHSCASVTATPQSKPPSLVFR